MEIRRTKYKRTTPKSQTMISLWNLNLGDGLDRLLIAASKLIEKYFGLLYLNMSLIFR